MTTVDVVLTPNVDDDQTASAQAQINSCPNGTAGNPNIINMPAGRYRINGRLVLSRRRHIRLTCPAGVPTYPNPPSDSQAFVAYTDRDGISLGIISGTRSIRSHFTFSRCVDVIGSFLRIEGPNRTRSPENALYPRYSSTREGEFGFGLIISEDCGFEDCSYQEIFGDGCTIDGYDTDTPPVMQTNRNVWCHRLVGAYAGRMLLGPLNVDGLEVVDAIDGFTGYGGVDIEPNPQQICWDATFTRVKVGCLRYPITLTGQMYQDRFGPFRVLPGGFVGEYCKKDITFTDFTVLRCGTLTLPSFAVLTRVGGLLTVDDLTDLRQRSNCGFNWYSANHNDTENVTIKNCRVIEQTNQTSYAVQVKCIDTLTIINNNFSGTGITGFDNLVTLSGVVPDTYVHYGNIWGDGSLNDGLAPVPATALFASSGHVSVAGGAASVLVAAPAPPEPVSPSSFFGGAPIRPRSHKGWARLRGAASSRIRGNEGPAERHPMRLRSPAGAGRLRSAQHPSYLRSKEPTAVPATFFTITAGHVALSGGTALLSTRVPAATGDLSLAGGTAGTSVVGTIRPLFATSGELAIMGGWGAQPLIVIAGQISIAGSATSTLRYVATSGGIALAGGTALLRVALPATSGQMAIAGSIAGLNGESGLSATSAQLSLVGATATLGIRTAATTSGHITVQGGTATVGLTKIIHATPGELAFLGGQAALHTLYRVGTDTITIHGGMGELSATEHVDLAISPGDIHINGGTAHLNTYNQYPEWPMGTQAPEWEMADA